jgi:hypothetical protein
MIAVQFTRICGAGVLSGLITLGAGAVVMGKADGKAENPVSEHASIAAYPTAVISLRDAESGLLFYVESNGRRLVAFEKEGTVKWSVDIFAAGKFRPDKGPAVIRQLTWGKGSLFATCGRSAAAKIEPQTGKVEFQGED